MRFHLRPIFTVRTAIVLVLIIAAALRIILIWSGGQNFNPDEDRYLTSKEAARLLAAGKIIEGLAEPFEAGDHVGFKFIGVLPALVELTWKEDPRIPAIFFGSFSWLSVVLIGRIARRLGGDEKCELAAVFLAATSSTLFYNARSILPYDASLASALLGWWIALKRPASATRSLVAGFLCAWSFIIYFGYWTIAGAIMLLHLAWYPSRILDVISRAVYTALGFVLGLSIPLLLNQFGSGRMIAGARGLSGTIIAGDYRGHIVPWEFLLVSERIWFIFAAAGLGWLIVCSKRRGDIIERRIVLQLVLAVLFIWACFILTSTVLHKFVVHGRLIRQLTPFFALGGGFALALLHREFRGLRRVGVLALAALLASDAAARFAQPLTQKFPHDFRPQAERVRRESTLPDTERAYWRMLNVDHYVYEVEPFRGRVVEEPLRIKHPFEYLPLIYESHSPAERRARRKADHSMRLVYVEPPSSWIPTGSGEGFWEMEVTFPLGRTGYSEPLLSLGNHVGADVLLVRYEWDNKIRPVIERMPGLLVTGDAIHFIPGKRHFIRFFSGRYSTSHQATARKQQIERLVLEIDGQTVLDRLLMNTGPIGELATPGFNYAGSGNCGSQFTGEIWRVERTDAVPPSNEVEVMTGPAKIVIAMTGPKGAGAEPLISVGEPGRAVFAYLRFPNEDRVVFGIEVWGVGTRESRPFQVRTGEVFHVQLEAGLLVGDTSELKSAMADDLRSHVRLFVNEQEEVSLVHRWSEGVSGTVAFGANPIGGSFVNPNLAGARVIEHRLLGPTDFLGASRRSK